ncbi:TolB family protein [Chloroflexus sp.]|uniref:TolB family protein n=1 Tax=Chloroflexus sp. TaxID=1904827 RepID=UPI003C70CD94
MRWCLIIVVIVLFAGCSATTLPSVPSSPTPTPSSAVVQPTPGIRILPAPLYILDRGQIARIEADGATRRQLTRERIEFAGIPPISDMDLHPTAGLIYVVGDAQGDRLVRASLDGDNPETIFFETDYQLSAVRWSPDAQFIYLHLQNNRTTRDQPDGLYRVPATGGPLELLRADDPVDDPLNPSRSVRSYAPLLWEPSGDSLILASTATFYDDCELVFWRPQDGELRRPVLPEGMQSWCGEAMWRSDQTALMLIGPPEGPGVWQVDTRTLQATRLSTEGTLARAPFFNGTDLLFIAVDRADDGFTFTLTRQSPDGMVTPLRPPFREVPVLVRWAPDGSGIVALVRTETGTSLRWYPIGEQPAVTLPQTESGATWLMWGSIPPQGQR